MNKWRIDVIDKSNIQNRRIYYNVAGVQTERVFELGEWVYKACIYVANNMGTIITEYYDYENSNIILSTYKEAAT